MDDSFIYFQFRFWPFIFYIQCIYCNIYLGGAIKNNRAQIEFSTYMVTVARTKSQNYKIDLFVNSSYCLLICT